LYFNKIEILYFKSSLDLHFNFYFCVSNRWAILVNAHRIQNKNHIEM
jgi:hypothetical protein